MKVKEDCEGGRKGRREGDEKNRERERERERKKMVERRKRDEDTYTYTHEDRKFNVEKL